ncbi:class I SAM-dependent RNA methyltransferase [Beijerinckia indica]|uniref:Putative RNA methyltransferase n=1 Tax=Beijerinckia indica subsp. indica (strain ATCC 9039 / DSM 1715 / NCIMB 8712) TaxID=395963 RepID=B2IDK6_BEII9|nr:class I SAM-dependent RNA methyltransferase [Beijerinckia indica]ACB95442.1 putative RNA methyltransferase [Beijerinckia indica subsp. indica ATCC 9039]
MIDLCAHLTIDRLGQRGEGIAQTAEGLVFVPYALPHETIIAEIDGERGHLAEILTPSTERIEAFCPAFTQCGGCAVQTLAMASYAQWKRGLVVEVLRHACPDTKIAPLVDAHGDGRRRATLHARLSLEGQAPAGTMQVGFMRARSHALIALTSCPLFAPTLSSALPATLALAQTLAALLGPKIKPFDFIVTTTLTGLDIDLRGAGPLSKAVNEKLSSLALKLGLARLSNHGVVLLERETPLVRIGRWNVALPPGAFLQATEAGEAALASRVVAALAGRRKIADLFAGLGTFSLPLAESAQVHAFDLEQAPLTALAKASHAPGLHPVEVERRDLFRRPLATELAGYDAIVFDPPRAGAEQQARALAASVVPVVVAVSCNPQTFARDASILRAGGYDLREVTPIDQFRHSPHVELIGVFERQPQKKKRRLLG